MIELNILIPQIPKTILLMTFFKMTLMEMEYQMKSKILLAQIGATLIPMVEGCRMALNAHNHSGILNVQVRDSTLLTRAMILRRTR